jgi:hypothetical protein
VEAVQPTDTEDFVVARLAWPAKSPSGSRTERAYLRAAYLANSGYGPTIPETAEQLGAALALGATENAAVVKASLRLFLPHWLFRTQHSNLGSFESHPCVAPSFDPV